MNLESMLRTYDETALEALSSKGLVRRARRDLEAGLAAIIAQEAGAATVSADSQTVTLDLRGPQSAQCTCPATGTCRHIVLAVLALREKQDEDSKDSSADTDSAIRSLLDLDESDIEKFAGKDWQKAITVVADGERMELEETGQNCVVELPDLKATVTFIAGEELRGAVCKGAKSRRRLAITVAALLVRAREGVQGSEQASAVATVVVSQEYLAHLTDALERAVRMVLPARSAVAADLLLDLAISVRTEALPRMSAQLRSLAHQAELAAGRERLFEPDSFLIDAARAYALVEALKRKPDDPELAGTVRRDYLSAEPIDVWVLGATVWRTEVGARGISTYCFAPETRNWHVVTQGRAAGADPAFDPNAMYAMPFLNAALMRDAMGKGLHIDKPQIASDGTISAGAQGSATMLKTHPALAGLRESGAVFDGWADLRGDLARRLGSGLRRRSAPVPVAIALSGVRGYSFSDLDQIFELEVVDQAGHSLIISLPADDQITASRLFEEWRTIPAILTVASCVASRLDIRPIAFLREEAGSLAVQNLELDRWPAAKARARTMQRLRKALTGEPKPASYRPDAIDTLVSRAIDAATAAVERSHMRDIDGIARTCGASGLTTLSRALEYMSRSPSTRSALATAYIAAEAATANLFLTTA